MTIVRESYRSNDGLQIVTESDYVFLHSHNGLFWFAPENGTGRPEGFMKVESCPHWHLKYCGDIFEFVTSKGYL
jgi:hypothetical protein